MSDKSATPYHKLLFNSFSNSLKVRRSRLAWMLWITMLVKICEGRKLIVWRPLKTWSSFDEVASSGPHMP